MTDLSLSNLVVTGLAATAGVTALGVAAHIAQEYALVPPDHGGFTRVGVKYSRVHLDRYPPHIRDWSFLVRQEQPSPPVEQKRL
jgi:hypothetical protein